jgi:hypothetical protein
VIEDLVDPRRTEPPPVLAERPMLEAWLDFHRTTLELKCEGLDDEARKRRPIGSSLLSLHGLIRHMAEVERNWFRRTLAREPDAEWLWGAADDCDFAPLADADWVADLDVWRRECESSRTIASTMSLDDTGIRAGQPCSLRWVYVHMIEEYARHNGHADLVRELLDGKVGW